MVITSKACGCWLPVSGGISNCWLPCYQCRDYTTYQHMFDMLICKCCCTLCRAVLQLEWSTIEAVLWMPASMSTEPRMGALRQLAVSGVKQVWYATLDERLQRWHIMWHRGCNHLGQASNPTSCTSSCTSPNNWLIRFGLIFVRWMTLIMATQHYAAWLLMVNLLSVLLQRLGVLDEALAQPSGRLMLQSLPPDALAAILSADTLPVTSENSVLAAGAWLAAIIQLKAEHAHAHDSNASALALAQVADCACWIRHDSRWSAPS